jgi:hypothetical protein
VDDVNLHIDELVIDHPVATPAQPASDALRHPLVDRLGVPIIAEIHRAVSAALDAGCILE